ncbi:unnamed protein product [Ambrosiozyma monospora]|uniref:Unnamed protein product n=1 Tax=Ambrosiozyma monospora TaxID=43982 RepID=A0ACB5SYF7_AMBMO|nr:unnamed protein product [Ambrosiozyma monospora]
MIDTNITTYKPFNSHLPSKTASSPFAGLGTPTSYLSRNNSQETFQRSASPYDINASVNKQQRDYSASAIAELESQSNEKLGMMSFKVSSLKELSMKMGDQIKNSKGSLANLNSDFDKAGSKIKGNMKRMYIMAEKSGIPLKVWFAFFAFVFFLFFYVWLF